MKTLLAGFICPEACKTHHYYSRALSRHAMGILTSINVLKDYQCKTSDEMRNMAEDGTYDFISQELLDMIRQKLQQKDTTTIPTEAGPSTSTNGSTSIRDLFMEIIKILSGNMQLLKETLAPMRARLETCEKEVLASKAIILKLLELTQKNTTHMENMALLQTQGRFSQAKTRTAALPSQSVSIGGTEINVPSSITTPDDRAHPVSTITIKQPLMNGMKQSYRRQVMEHWSTGLGKGHYTELPNLKKRHPLADPDMIEADRARKRTNLEMTGAKYVIPNAAARKPPKYPVRPSKEANIFNGSGELGEIGALKSASNTDFPMVFRQPLLLSLNREMSKIAAYVFHDKHDDLKEHLSGLLFKVGTLDIDRQAFYSLVPGNVVDPKIISGSLATMSYLSSDGRIKYQWFLPWSFADDVLSGVSEVEIIQRYQRSWMLVTNFLLRVFIPINDGGTWFMMLIDIKPWRVYALDVSRTEQSQR
ncbi:hypothetical protein PIB30_030974 [Stylosanthes scabra]|uniref:Uncharacterized protein n=1 Tax=Stylosanthes scabra TaxID=79078 RepID=A0ABU6TBH9_9FABA|nr:hypothetical protein [Stylosanthes scabra]